MRRAGLVLGSILALAPVCATAGPRSPLAPADEYFGRAAMSPIEITNRINDAERRGASYRRLTATQAAIVDWTSKYPHDPWIPSREYRMSHLFAKLHSPQGTAEAAACRDFIRVHFAGTRYAVDAEREAHPAIVRAPAKTQAAHQVAKTAGKKRHRFLGILF